MSKIFKTCLPVLVFVSFYSSLSAQNLVPSSIHKIEPAKNHYKELQKISAEARSGYEWMDPIAFPPGQYNRTAITYAMAQPIYLSTSQVDFLVSSIQYPANSSEQTRAELDFLLDLQQKRTSEQSSRVLELAAVGYWPHGSYVDDHPSNERNLEYLFFEASEVLNKKCDAKDYPHTTKLLKAVMSDMRLMEFAVKYHLLRARPYQLEPKLEPLRRINSPSFASGHTLWAYIQAYTFAELMPEKRKQFVDLAYEIALSREIMGVHYPSDEEAARQLAHRMLFLMWHTEKFQKDFEEAKKEWE